MRYHPPPMIGTERGKQESAVLLANASFYRAFSEGDQQAMSELWAARASVACFHPGSPLLLGRDAVLKSWQQILGQRPAFKLRCDVATVALFEGTAIVFCYEGGEGQPSHLAATNVFVLEDGGWRMVHHHAGPLSDPIPEPRSADLVN
jgi:ketosteroid isomerase-like protein